MPEGRNEMGFDFIGKRKIWFIISLLVIVPGLISIFSQGINWGIDYAGGTLIQVRFDEEQDTENLRALIGEAGYEDAGLQESEGSVFLIKTKEMTQEEQDEFTASLEEKAGAMEILRSEKVGPTIGKELRDAGIKALTIAIILMVVYITFRFEFKSGIAAILALVHDVLITVGVFSILQIELDSTFIAAILTIIGYSINDTIVIFDRIRENSKKNKKESLDVIVNRSLNQTLARSINTTLTVIFVLLSLYFLGGETTKSFVFALLIGVVSGAYSSIFTASPLWFEMKKVRKAS